MESKVIDLRNLSSDEFEIKYNQMIDDFNKYDWKEVIVKGKYISWIEVGKIYHYCRIEPEDKLIDIRNMKSIITI